MLHFEEFGGEPEPLAPGALIGRGVRLVFDPDAAMALSIRRAARTRPFGPTQPTLVVSGQNRAPEDWLGLEIDLPSPSADLSLTLRNYPANRLFPRLHYDFGNEVRHLDLADVAASDSFATRLFASASWAAAPGITAAMGLRLTVLIPSSPWFAMEIAGIETRETVHA